MRNALAGNQGISKHSSTEQIDTPSLTEIDPAGLVDGVYVVVVHTRTVDGSPRWSRRLYLSLHSAQKSLDRAVMRGQRAYLVLCKLQAVDTRLGGAL